MEEVCACKCKYLSQRHPTAWSQTPRRLGTAHHRCWDLNWGLLTTTPSLQLPNPLPVIYDISGLFKQNVNKVQNNSPSTNKGKGSKNMQKGGNNNNKRVNFDNMKKNSGNNNDS